MIKWIKGFFAPPSLDSFDGPIARERLIQTARIVMVDDEDSLLVDELKSAGFSVEHDRAGNDLRAIDSQLYDLAILDYHGVGGRLGTAQGLDLLKHIRRVSPRTRVLAYTSRSLSATESEFFRLSHGVLPKDLGLVDSMAVIEGELQKAMGKEHLLDALLTKLNVSDAEKKRDARDALAKALRGKNESQFKDYVTKLGGTIGEKAVDVIMSRLFGL
jgi:DNA-binding NarL/FixJ family response regulator